MVDNKLGKVILVGAGPGDPGLLTVRGQEYIGKADCIIYDRLASPQLLSLAKKNCEMIFVGKENHNHTLRQDEINELLYQKAKTCAIVVRLKGGDPYVFGRGGEEALYLKERNVEVEEVPGISSSIAALADAGIPITHRGLAKGFQVITAHSKKDQVSDIDFTQLVDETVTLVFLMGLAHVETIAASLMKVGRSADTPAAVISNGTTARQKKCVGTLANIAALVKESQVVSPAIIVVGNVVSLANELDFFEQRQLFGKTYVVPYIERFRFSYIHGIMPARKEEHFDSELEEKLREKGADVRSIKVGRIVPVAINEKDFKDALDTDWLVFTSQNGVHAFLWNLKERGLDIRSITKAKIAAVGARTAEALNEFALSVDLVPEVQTGKAMSEKLLSVGENGEKVTLFAAKESNPEVGEILATKFQYKKLVSYENQKLSVEESLQEAELSDIENLEGILFTSASSVKRVMAITDGKLPKHIYSIGPKCSEALVQFGVEEYSEAASASYQGLLELII